MSALLESRIAAADEYCLDSPFPAWPTDDIEARYRLLAEHSAEVVVEADGAGRLRYVSPACRRVLGYDPADLLGTRLSDLMHVEDRAQLGGSRDVAARTSATFRLRHRDGGMMWVEAESCRNHQNRVVPTLVTRLRDIGAQRQTVARAANAADRTKSEFLSVMSHELRTPLNAVLGFAQLLLLDGQSPLIDKQRQYVDYIVDSGTRLLGLISNLLDLAKIEAGTLEVAVEPVDPQTVLVEVFESVATLARSHGLTCDLRLSEPRLPAVRADKARLVQMLMNLAMNAVRYNRPGGRVELGLMQTDAGRLRLMVSDTGIGIAPARRADLFRPFNRLGAETCAADGVGIGLGICRQLAYLMGGSLGFTSTEGEGSEFWIELPPAETRRAADIAPVRATYTALCVAGDAIGREQVGDAVCAVPDARMLAASTGSAGLDLARTASPDVIIVDLRLPDMSGYKVLERLRNQPQTAAIPVLALGPATLQTDEVAACRAAGFADVITRSIPGPLLVAAIRRAVGITWH